MTDAEKKMKKYTKSVERKLNLPKDIKNRVISDFISSIHARREFGMTDEEIYAEFGSAKKAAAELNEQMKDYTYRKSPWRYLFAALAVYGVEELLGGLAAKLFALFSSMDFIMSNESTSIGIIGGADGPTAIFVTTPGWMHYINPMLFLMIGIYGFQRLRRCRHK